MKMNLFNIIIILSFLIMAIGLIGKAYILHNKYKEKQTFFYLLLIIFWNVFGIFGVLNFIIIPDLLKNPSSTIIVINSFFLIPIQGFFSYNLTAFTLGIFNIKISKLFNMIFVFVFLPIFLYSFFETIEFIDKINNNISGQIYSYSYIFMFLLILFNIVFFFFNLQKINTDIIKKVLFKFGIFFFPGFLLFFVLISIITPNSYSDNILICSILFGFNIPPFFIYRKYLQLISSPEFSNDINKNRLLDNYKKYKISKREIEVIDLIVKGKTNQEIENELFISIETVKKHIYNIYKKTDVKNRLQLINFLKSKVQ